jgi:hypothetical protein
MFSLLNTYTREMQAQIQESACELVFIIELSIVLQNKDINAIQQ